MNLNNKIVLITGASSGIGLSCARTFAEAGARLILLARREDRLMQLAAELNGHFGTESICLICDIRKFNEVEKSLDLPDKWKNVDVLINNAGLARGIEKLHESDIADWEEMIDANVKGLLYVSRKIIPGMVQRGNGMVINIGSIAGHEIYPGGSVYCGTKHAVKAISKGMTIDLNGTGVRVCSIDPGLIETEFSLVRFHGDEQRAAGIYKGYQPLLPDDIADMALYVATRPQHVMIQNIIVTPTAQASATIVHKKIEN